ncbi:hypothetical protein DEO72_LG7g1508 [Vigna unguiculata]|uniref:Uncharacterized protein n=1 Tax=Vigna unguiculata TaxID=3917 RepID=A0A4D6MHN3_VIGUN|nr:hypothetical protein DEO72_LG7g1508 [Vigna unguiculata]
MKSNKRYLKKDDATFDNSTTFDGLASFGQFEAAQSTFGGLKTAKFLYCVVGVAPPFWTDIRGGFTIVLNVISARLDNNSECCFAAISFTFDRRLGPLIEVNFGAASLAVQCSFAVVFWDVLG